MAEKMCIVVSEGHFDKAMMPLILGTTGASMGLEVHLFYTFFGLKLLTKGNKPKLPGMMRLFTGMIRKKMAKNKIPLPEEMMKTALDLGVNFYACSTSMTIMGVTEADLLPGVKVLGASAFLNLAADAKVNLFVG
jgi:peroxiredoxin family protein